MDDGGGEKSKDFEEDELLWDDDEILKELKMDDDALDKELEEEEPEIFGHLDKPALEEEASYFSRRTNGCYKSIFIGN